MTDRYSKTETDTMTGTDAPDDDIPGIDDDVFEKHRVVRMGELGDDIVEKEHEEMDFDEMKERVEVVAFQVCQCGDTLDTPTDGYKCANCTKLACPECRIKISRYNYCPDCVRKRFGVTRDLYIALYLLDQGTIKPVDLVGAGAVGGDIAPVDMGDTAATLLDRGLVRTDDTSPMSAAFGDDDPLTGEAKEVLKAGEKLYGDDPDIEELERKITIQQIANNGR
jgi:DNA-directed RNA polymerase subunit RPC12/RpoP